MPGGEVLSPVGKRDHLLVVELFLMAFVKGEPKSELFKQLITHRFAHLVLVVHQDSAEKSSVGLI